MDHHHFQERKKKKKTVVSPIVSKELGGLTGKNVYWGVSSAKFMTLRGLIKMFTDEEHQEKPVEACKIQTHGRQSEDNMFGAPTSELE